MKASLDKVQPDPVDRYADLDPPVKDWLERATPEKLKRLDSLVKLADNLEFVGRAGKWLLYGILGTTILFASAGDALKKLMGWWPK